MTFRGEYVANKVMSVLRNTIDFTAMKYLVPLHGPHIKERRFIIRERVSDLL